MPKIQFTEDYVVQDARKTTYLKGTILECSYPSMRHFVNKGVAFPVRVVELKKKESKEPIVKTTIHETSK